MLVDYLFHLIIEALKIKMGFLIFCDAQYD